VEFSLGLSIELNVIWVSSMLEAGKVVGASIIQSKQAVVSLLTIMTGSHMISATSYDKTLVMAKVIALWLHQVPPQLSIIQ